jgi:hypothetical protein
MGVKIMEVLQKPLSIKEIKERLVDKIYVEGVVPVKLDDIVENNYEGFLDILAEALIGSHQLYDIQYSVVGHQDENIILIKVSGDVSQFLEENEEE